MANGWMRRGVTVATLAAGLWGCNNEAKYAESSVPDAGPMLPPPPVILDGGSVAPPLLTGPCDSTQTLAMSSMFQARAPKEAPGMKPEGPPICFMVPEGQQAAGTTFMLEPGYCYTFLGQSLPGISAMNMQLEVDVAGAGLPPALAALNVKPVLAVDSGPGPQTGVAAGQACFLWPWPIPAMVKVVVKAHAGSGPVAAQAYKKKK
jgi:hypothetical protein